MTRISGGAVEQLVAVLRLQLARSGAPAARPGAPRKGKTQADPRLADLIALRVRAIGRDDPDRGRKAFRVFLEAVLLAQFGEQLLNDPAFHLMVADVQTALEADAACRQLIDRAIDELLKQAQ